MKLVMNERDELENLILGLRSMQTMVSTGVVDTMLAPSEVIRFKAMLLRMKNRISDKIADYEVKRTSDVECED